MPFNLVKPIIGSNIRNLCILPYAGHPRGCPNYNKKRHCPPNCRLISEIINLQENVFAIWNEFNFKEHCQRMKQKHPLWSIRQIECCLYWQPRARKQLRFKIIKFLKEHHNQFIIVANPEGTGINVTATMKQIGIILEWPPKIKTYQVALAGTRK